jgi:hypothetical protein
MMKHTFAKKALLLGAISILFSIFPVHAMDNAAPMDPALQKEVQTKAGFFSNWSREGLRKKLDENMKFLDTKWKDLMKCLKGEGCTRGQIAVITGTLATILAIITVLTYGVAYRKGLITGGRLAAPGRFVAGLPERAQARFTEGTAILQEKIGTPFQKRVVTPATERLGTWGAAARQRAARLPYIGSRFASPPPEGEIQF